MITGVQIIGIAFALLMAYLTFLHRKRREFSRAEGTAWLFFWGILILSLLFPNTLNIITERLGIVRAFDLFAIVGFIVITSLVFHNYVTLAKLKKKLETTVRDEALRDLPHQTTHQE